MKTRSRRRLGGFTLTELMIAVVILGVLAAVASAGYGSYIRRARASEARTQLAAIAARETAYRSEFGVFCGAGRSGVPTTTGISNAWPTATPGQNADFNASAPTQWAELGFRPSGRVRFRYVVVPGAPGATPPGETSPAGDLWYVAEAYSDLDGDSTLSTFRHYSLGPGVVAVGSETE
ncbi:MAG: prepilin-type N-terminal cleavage/methylation domain-containing protein [Deltaproteobacteria bacterium]|nr:prepilin-type N-terminal cleavage/methylation domain-containing protein [Deltaproteobacteria bacterium]